MLTDPKVQELLAPLTEQDVDPASRRFQVDREKIISRMVDVSLTPEERFSSRARVAGVLALAAGVVLAAWGGLRAWQHGARPDAPGLEVVALRGQVTGLRGAIVNGEATELAAQGSLQTSPGAEARIKTKSGMEIELLENTQVSLNELAVVNGAAALRLERGRVRCVIPHQPGRTFSVVTAAARVVDIGTTFSVSIEQTASGPRTIVQVEEGQVLVEHAGQESRLSAAQSWTSDAAKPADVAPPPSVEVDQLPSSPGPHREPVRRHPETLAIETKLLRSGLASEQKGDLRAAAQAFEALVSRYPDSQLAPDAKAALARVKGRLESSK